MKSLIMITALASVLLCSACTRTCRTDAGCPRPQVCWTEPESNKQGECVSREQHVVRMEMYREVQRRLVLKTLGISPKFEVSGSAGSPSPLR
jgi:hypothetical protein